MTLQLTTTLRDAATKPTAVRSAGNIPAVVYGAGSDATSIAVPETAFISTWKEAGEATVIHLLVGDKKESVLIQDVQRDPVSGKIQHIDFKVIEAGVSITVTVPLEFIGESPAAKANLGTLTKVLHEVEVEVLPKDLPSEIEVDLSALVTLEDQILVSDLKLPEGVSVLNNPEEAVAVMTAAKEEVEEESEEIDFSAIEVEKKGKAEDPEAAGEDA